MQIGTWVLRASLLGLLLGTCADHQSSKIPFSNVKIKVLSIAPSYRMSETLNPITAGGSVRLTYRLGRKYGLLTSRYIESTDTFGNGYLDTLVICGYLLRHDGKPSGCHTMHLIENQWKLEPSKVDAGQLIDPPDSWIRYCLNLLQKSIKLGNKHSPAINKM